MFVHPLVCGAHITGEGWPMSAFGTANVPARGQRICMMYLKEAAAGTLTTGQPMIFPLLTQLATKKTMHSPYSAGYTNA